jgi:hypothetical protein
MSSTLETTPGSFGDVAAAASRLGVWTFGSVATNVRLNRAEGPAEVRPGRKEAVSKHPNICADGSLTRPFRRSARIIILIVSVSDLVICDGSVTRRHRKVGKAPCDVTDRETRF